MDMKNKSMLTPLVRFIFIGILLSTSCSKAFADSPIGFVRISCVQESRFLRLEYFSLNSSSVLLNEVSDERKIRQRMNVWRKHGFYDPANLNYKCDLSEATYEVTATQPPASDHGLCGDSPPVTINLKRNGEKIFDNVKLGYSCSGIASVSSITIADGMTGWDERNMKLCMYPTGQTEIGDVRKEACRYFSETYNQISNSIPINQKKIEQYAQENSQ